MAEKIVTLEELTELVKAYKRDGKVVSLCHGCFDLVHPGRIRHLKEARRAGDVLVVTVTSDRYVNKGPGRPLFPEQLRLEQLAALEFVNARGVESLADCDRNARPGAAERVRERF